MCTQQARVTSQRADVNFSPAETECVLHLPDVCKAATIRLPQKAGPVCPPVFRCVASHRNTDGLSERMEVILRVNTFLNIGVKL